MRQDMILILDLGSEENARLAREIRALGVYSEIHPHDITLEELEALPNVKASSSTAAPTVWWMAWRSTQQRKFITAASLSFWQITGGMHPGRPIRKSAERLFPTLSLESAVPRQTGIWRILSPTR